jgi:hypothetical protein
MLDQPGAQGRLNRIVAAWARQLLGLIGIHGMGRSNDDFIFF